MQSATAPAVPLPAAGRSRSWVRSRSAIVREEIDQQSDRASGAALLRTTQVGDAGDIEVRPAQPLGELREEAGSSDRAPFASRGIGEIGEVALELLVVFLRHRHVPDAILGTLPGGD